MWQRIIDCLGVAVAIESHVPEIAAQLEAVFRSYADTEEAAALAYRLEVVTWPRLVRDGVMVAHHDTPLDLVAALELDVYQQIVPRADGLLLHAGAVAGGNGRAIVMAGASGAGKSTLVRALLARGFAYVSEECVALTERGGLRGLSRALHVDDPSLPCPAGFLCDDYVLRTAHGERRTRLFHPPERTIARGTVTAAAVIAISHADDAKDSLLELSTGEALSRLWPALFRTDATRAIEAAAYLGVPRRFALHTSTPARALDLVLSLAAELDVVAG